MSTVKTAYQLVRQPNGVFWDLVPPPTWDFEPATRIPGIVTGDSWELRGSADALATYLKLINQPVPPKLRAPPLLPTILWSKDRNGNRLMPFQTVDAAFTRDNITRGVLNRTDVGLGKTVVTICALRQLDRSVAKVVLCPASLKSQWLEEIQKWGREDDTAAILWPSSHLRAKRPIPNKPDWIIAFYLDADRALALVEDRPYFLIIDEIHNLRGYGTQRQQAVYGLSNFAMGRVGLTASALYNKPNKLHPIFDLVSPGCWGSYGAFVERYASGRPNPYGGYDTGALSNLPELNDRLTYFSFRRVREDMADQLPFEAVYQTIWLDQPSTDWAKPIQINLNQATLATLAVKTQAAIEQVKSDIEAGLPSITFTWYRPQAQKIAEATRAFLVMGGGDPSTRLERIKSYVKWCEMKNTTPAVVGTMGALGEGANLQWAKAVNLAWLDWTPDTIRQVIGRVLRMGQTGKVLVRLFMCRRSIDEHYNAILKTKLKEHFRFDQRREKSKDDLYQLLSPKSVKDTLRQMVERAWAEEKAEASK